MAETDDDLDLADEPLFQPGVAADVGGTGVGEAGPGGGDGDAGGGGDLAGDYGPVDADGEE